MNFHEIFIFRIEEKNSHPHGAAPEGGDLKKTDDDDTVVKVSV